MRAVIWREWKNSLRNPVFWAGLLVMAVGLYQMLSPYLGLHYFQTEAELEERQVFTEPEDLIEADILDGYLPATELEQREAAYQCIRRFLTEVLEYSEQKADSEIFIIREKNLDRAGLFDYMAENYRFYGDPFFGTNVKKGSLEEVNAYIGEKLKEHSFSWYFSRKYVDFAGLFLCFFAAVLLAFLYLRDMKRDTYELLHTKPVSANAYIGGKALGGFLSTLTVLVLLNLVFGAMCGAAGKRAGLPVDHLELWRVALVYIVPNLLMITCVYTIVAVLFKNPLPGAPLLILYFIYSNMGSEGPDGYGYYGRPLAVMVRFPGRFLEIAPPPMAAVNQIFLLAASCLLIFIAAAIWKRRRVY